MRFKLHLLEDGSWWRSSVNLLKLYTLQTVYGCMEVCTNLLLRKLESLLLFRRRYPWMP